MAAIVAMMGDRNGRPDCCQDCRIAKLHICVAILLSAADSNFKKKIERGKNQRKSKGGKEKGEKEG